MTPELVEDRPTLPPRDPAGHKGTFGTVAVVGGCAGGDATRMMLGAPALAGLAALRSGAGLVTLVVPAPLLPMAIAICPAATGFAIPVDALGAMNASGAAAQIDRALEGAHALVLGPGLEHGTAQQQIVVRLVSRTAPPMVVDADALNALAALRESAHDLRAPCILTPHPGEFDRLAKALALELPPRASTDVALRPAAAAALARRLGAIVVLKGAGTIVSDGLRAWRCDHGNAALAVGGSGDVLSGILGGIAAQFVRPPHSMALFDIARLGVLIHAMAAERWAAQHGTAGLVPTDLCGEIPDTLATLRG